MRLSRYLASMTIFLLAVIAVGVFLIGRLQGAFLANPLLNAVLIAVWLIGIGYIFIQTFRLSPEIKWVQEVQRNRLAAKDIEPPPLMGSLARLMESRTTPLSLTPTALRAVLDGIAVRLDESREIARYFTGLMIFLGLLGTFWGLLRTVGSVGAVVNGLSVTADPTELFTNLKAGLQGPLSGMGTAFGSSLLGLAGSLVLGFLDLQMGQAQNRFFLDLENWLFASAGANERGLGETASPLPVIQTLVDRTAANIDSFGKVMAEAETGRQRSAEVLWALGQKIDALVAAEENQQQVIDTSAAATDGNRHGADGRAEPDRPDAGLRRTWRRPSRHQPSAGDRDRHPAPGQRSDPDPRQGAGRSARRDRPAGALDRDRYRQQSRRLTMALSRRGYRTELNVWPGWVDGLSSLIIVVIFVLMVFVIAQAFLQQQLAGKDRTLLALNRRVAELNQMLGKERDTATTLKAQIATVTANLNAVTAERDKITDTAERLGRPGAGAIAADRRPDGGPAEAERRAGPSQCQGGGADDDDCRTDAEAECRAGRRKSTELARYRSEFFGRLREVLGNRTDIRIVGDRFVFQSEVLFPTASATLEDSGKEQLKKLAQTLLEISKTIPDNVNWVLRVDGHTDRRPIHTDQFPSNWALSTARATAVVQFLITQGVPPNRLAAAGFAEFQPVDNGTDDTALAHNRRIELKFDQR